MAETNLTENLRTFKGATSGKFAEQQRINSDYIERERDFLNDPAKIPERNRIADFILEHHAPEEKIRLLSLPSLHWSFENLLIEKSPDREYRFFGLEWTWGVMEMGKPYMPGGRTVEHIIKLAIGVIKGFVTHPHTKKSRIYSHWLWVNAGDFLSLKSSDKKGKDGQLRFAYVYKRMSAIWLDFTSQLCAETRRALTHLGSYCDAKKYDVPSVVTVMAARDEHDDDEDRVFEICELLNENPYRQFCPEFHWKYINNDIPMLSVAGLLIRR